MTTFREGGYGAAEAAAEVRPYQIVKLNADDKVVLATSATDIAGVVETGAKVGATAAFALLNGQGTFKVRLGGTVAKGDQLTSNASGLAVKTTTAGNVVFGTAVTAGVAGDVVEYLKCDKVVAAA